MVNADVNEPTEAESGAEVTDANAESEEFIAGLSVGESDAALIGEICGEELGL